MNTTTSDKCQDYQILKDRLRSLLKELEVRNVQYDYKNKLVVPSVKSVENQKHGISHSNAAKKKSIIKQNDPIKDSDKVDRLHTEFSTLTTNLNNIKNIIFENTSSNSVDNCRFGSKQLLLDELGEVVLDLVKSDGNNTPVHHTHSNVETMDLNASISQTHLDFLVDEIPLEIQKKLSRLNEKCNKMRLQVSSKQELLLSYQAQTPELVYSNPNNCLDEYNNLIRAYEDRIITMKSLCAKYKKVIMEKHLFIQKFDGATATIINRQENEQELKETSTQGLKDQKILMAQLKSTSLQLQGEVLKLEKAMELLKSKNLLSCQ